VHTPHTHVSCPPQVFAPATQRVKKWVSPPVGSVVSREQLNANANAASRTVTRLLALLRMVFVIAVFMKQALPRVDHDPSVRLRNRLFAVEFTDALPHVGEHAAQAGEGAEHLVF